MGWAAPRGRFRKFIDLENEQILAWPIAIKQNLNSCSFKDEWNVYRRFVRPTAEFGFQVAYGQVGTAPSSSIPNILASKENAGRK
jgi:hypothetical protein